MRHNCSARLTMPGSRPGMAACNSACAISPLPETIGATRPAAMRNGSRLLRTNPFRRRLPEGAMAACSDRPAASISGSEETKMTTVTNHVVSGTTPLPASSSDSASLNSSAGSTLAGNFQSFLTLLTTQLQNQNPLDPLDTNQFTQQLVQFAGVEQQLKTNDSLQTLVTMQQTAQATQALEFGGKTAIVSGNSTALSNSKATWELNVPTASTVNISIANSSGQTVYSGNFSATAGNNQPFAWNGQGNDGTQWPDGIY